MRKIKKLKEQVDCLTKKLETLENQFDKYKLDIKTREYLIRTNFFGMIKTEPGKELLMNVVFSDKHGIKYCFDEVKEQIINYDFDCMFMLLNRIMFCENTEAEAEQGKPTTISNTKVEDVAIKMGDTKHNEDVSAIVMKPKKQPTQLAKYASNNKYFINNIADFYKPKLMGRVLSKNDLVTFINLIIECQGDINKMCKKLNCSKYAISKYATTAREVGIIEQRATGGKITLSNAVKYSKLR